MDDKSSILKKRKIMNYSWISGVFLLLMVLFCVVGCMPVSSRSYAPTLEEKSVLNWLAKGEKCVVFPLWRQLPFFYTDDRHEASIYYIGTPLFLSQRDLFDISDKIPVKVSRGLVSVTFQIGRETQFLGAYVVSIEGKAVWLQDNQFPNDHKWTNIKYAYLGKLWVDEIKSGIRNKRVTISSSHQSFWNTLSWDKGFSSLQMRISSRKRDECSEFFRTMPTKQENVSTDKWINTPF